VWRFISFRSSDNKTGRRGKRVEARFNTDLLTTELGAVMDVSASGVRVRCGGGAVRVAAGDVMPLTLRSPGSDLTVVCRVVRVKKAGLRGGAEVSLAFVHADAELRKAIQHLGRFGFLPQSGQRNAAAAGAKPGAKTGGASTAGNARRRRPKPPLPDYYAVLGVGPDASQEQVRHAYHLLARQQHPDATRDERSAAAFQAITDAYRVLRDPRARREYDDARGDQPSSHAA
jgi:hypothetical protein